jgi:hypothetical protein
MKVEWWNLEAELGPYANMEFYINGIFAKAGCWMVEW